MEASTFVLPVSTTATFGVCSVTYMREPSGESATPQGVPPRGTDIVAVCVDRSTIERLAVPWSAVYARLPSAETATPMGLAPTGTVDVTEFEAKLITDSCEPRSSVTRRP